MKFISRPNQIKVFDGARSSIGKGHKSIVIQGATGFGKTHVAAMILEAIIAKKNHALFVADRRKLVHQCALKLAHDEISHGVIMRGEYGNCLAPVQVCSIQTLEARYFKEKGELFKNKLPEADVIIFDECHKSINPAFDKVRKLYPNAIFIGLTATPVLGNGKGLGSRFTDIIYGPPVKELTEMGILVPMDYYGGDIADYSQVPISKVTGEVDEDEAARVADQPKLIGDIVKNWKSHGQGRQTLGFFQSVSHSKHACQALLDAGFRAEHIDASTDDTPDGEREKIYRRFHRCETTILCNYGIAIEGYDEQKVGCIIGAQRTRNPGRFVQATGRGARAFSGDQYAHRKEDCIYLDHAGCVTEQNWRFDDDFGWDLSKDETIQERQFKKQQSEPLTAPKPPRLCPQCKAIFRTGRKCGKCGFEFPLSAGEPVPFIDAELKRLIARNTPKPKPEKQPPFRDDQKQEVYSQLLGIQIEKGHKPGWSSMQYKETFGQWPNGLDKTPQEPTDRILRLVKSRLIRYFKSKEAEKATS